jgi:hypothetical protein
LYREFLPMLNSGQVELLEHARMVAQFANLERRVSRAGRESIHSPPGGHEDVANAVAGAVAHAAKPNSMRIGISLAGHGGPYYFPDENGFYPWNKPVDWPDEVSAIERGDPAWIEIGRKGGRPAIEAILRERGRLPAHN